MKQSSYAMLRDFVYERTGIQLGNSKQALVLARVSQRLRALGRSDPDEYVRDVLNGGDDEEGMNPVMQIANKVATNLPAIAEAWAASKQQPQPS